MVEFLLSLQVRNVRGVTITKEIPNNTGKAEWVSAVVIGAFSGSEVNIRHDVGEMDIIVHCLKVGRCWSIACFARGTGRNSL